jgi:hypothetical protein
MFQQEHITAFQTAAQYGIPRVVHAGFFGWFHTTTNRLQSTAEVVILQQKVMVIRMKE